MHSLTGNHTSLSPCLPATLLAPALAGPPHPPTHASTHPPTLPHPPTWEQLHLVGPLGRQRQQRGRQRLQLVQPRDWDDVHDAQLRLRLAADVLQLLGLRQAAMRR